MVFPVYCGCTLLGIIFFLRFVILNVQRVVPVAMGDGTASSARIPSMHTVGATACVLSRDIFTVGLAASLLIYPIPMLCVEWANKSSTRRCWCCFWWGSNGTSNTLSASSPPSRRALGPRNGDSRNLSLMAHSTASVAHASDSNILPHSLANAVFINSSPTPEVHTAAERPWCVWAKQPLPKRAPCPTRPGLFSRMPPLDTADATTPLASQQTTPTVSKRPEQPVLCAADSFAWLTVPDSFRFLLPYPSSSLRSRKCWRRGGAADVCTRVLPSSMNRVAPSRPVLWCGFTAFCLYGTTGAGPAKLVPVATLFSWPTSTAAGLLCFSVPTCEKSNKNTTGVAFFIIQNIQNAFFYKLKPRGVAFCIFWIRDVFCT